VSNTEATRKDAVIRSGDSDRISVPLAVEELAVTKETRETGRVRVSTVTREHEELVDELLERQEVAVERVPIGKRIEAIPPVREEADMIVIPIVEEVLVVERHLVLKEEVHIRRVRGTERHQERVTLRKQEAVVTRLPVETATNEPGSSVKDRVLDSNEEKK
jgi:uncharacterized protein (TIGR02271 family)